MNAGMLGMLFTVMIFGAIGWIAARLLSRQLGARYLVVLSIILVVAAIAAIYIRSDIWLFGVDNFGMPLKLVIIASCLGGCVGFLIRVRALRQLMKA